MKNSDEQIRFAIGECLLGKILVGVSEQGICAIAFGDNPETLASDLHKRYPKGRLIADDRRLPQIIAKVIDYVESPGMALDFPLDLRGTTFQQRVWQALREVPIGSTISYADLARRIGLPQSVRAVAGACAANPLAVVIPCHRVIRTDGSLSGYRWGVGRKAQLLSRERKA